MTLVSRLPEFTDALNEAVDAGLFAMGYLYANEVKRRTAGGFTSGDFVTGAALNAITVTDPYTDDDGARAIQVYSDLEPNYPLYWELGHHNIFTRRFERVEIWRPVSVDLASQLQAVFQSTVQARMGAFNA